MSKSNLKQEYTDNDLTAALDHSVEAAVALSISEHDLVAQLVHRLHDKAPIKPVPSHVEPQRKLFDPLAGP